MNTIPTHLVINAAINKKYGSKFKLIRSAFLWASVAPDIPLFILSIGYFIYLRFFTTQSLSEGISYAFDTLFFNDPLWIFSHNLLHSPTLLVIFALLLWRFKDKSNKRGKWWLSFVFGSMVHSMVDILTHHDDGPLLFFPFDWQRRFYSPISYWDSNHYAGQVFWVEVSINILLVGYLFLPKLIGYFRKRHSR
ncbi:MAG: metal-dependent hydrolase [Chloroflexi bacterium]|nr:metal-dependent hydrolase [Chloroflexota bacterium]